jgi:hypothetical protein
MLKGDMAWEGKTLMSPSHYTLTLTPEDVREICDALRHFNSTSSSSSNLDAEVSTPILTGQGLGLYGSEVGSHNFPLPTLSRKLLSISVDIHQGKGFALIRGLNPREFSPEDNVVIFLGVSSYIGSSRGRQDENGDMLSKFRTRSTEDAHMDDLTASQYTFGTQSTPGRLSLTGQRDIPLEHQ